MNESVEGEPVLLEILKPLLEANNETQHLSLQDWSLLLNGGGTETEVDRVGGHLMGCRACSQVLLEAEDYAERVRDVERLESLTPRYVPDATSHRLILEVAESRLWIERVRSGWLVADMDLDVEVVAPDLKDAQEELSVRVRQRCRELGSLSGPKFRGERRMLALLDGRGESWADIFEAELPIVMEEASSRILTLTGSEGEVESVQIEERGARLMTEAQMALQSDDFHTALQLTQTMLNALPQPVDPPTIRRKASSILGLLRAENGQIDVDEELLVKELEARFTTYVGDFGILVDHDDREHRPWLTDRRASIDWKFWRRYDRFLREKKGLAPASMVSLNRLTDTILDHLEDPKKPGKWHRRGLVVGSVQSGKTANYTGLICKAADAGYKLIIVMAGLHNNLRSQTQWRLDEGFLGYDTKRGRRLDNQPNQKIGVGRLRGAGPFFTALTLTNNDVLGDFNRNIARSGGIVPGGDAQPVILIVKKHKSILENVRKWALDVLGEEADGTYRVPDVPLLLIDDEADNASINTARPSVNPEEYSVTAINEQIRRLLGAFEQNAYVGYTATPFANIFISPEDETPELGKDIFPENFIVSIPPPSNYVGPAHVFGMARDAELGNEETSELPIIRRVYDHENVFPAKRRSGLQVTELPPSLKTAIRAFVLTCAARRARGQKTDHNSMLVHVTRAVSVQGQVEGLIQEEITAIQHQIGFGNGTIGRELLLELEHLWRTDFMPTTEAMGELAGRNVTWEQVRQNLPEAVARMDTRAVNSESRVALDYVEHANGINVIVVGGDKLSRGLTLEGLSVSYYLRTTNMYDTLMQMGRWFGYRPGYLDLCRLYTTEELALWYRHIALADAELRREFDRMEKVGATPLDYALRVRTHPEGMLITALNKMRRTVVAKYSFSDTVAEVSFLHRETDRVLGNFKATDAFVRSMGEPSTIVRDNLVWRGRSAEEVSDFLTRLVSHPHATSADTFRLAEYIRVQSGREELTDWTVALISNSRPDPQYSSEVPIGGHTVRTSWRKPADYDDGGPLPSVYTIRQGRIINPPDEYLDFDLTLPSDRALYDEALADTIRAWRENKDRRGTIEPARPSGAAIRAVRPATRGLLILYPLFPSPELYDSAVEAVIGHALSFPKSPTAEGVEYRVGESFWRQELGEEDEDDI